MNENNTPSEQPSLNTPEQNTPVETAGFEAPVTPAAPAVPVTPAAVAPVEPVTPPVAAVPAVQAATPASATPAAQATPPVNAHELPASFASPAAALRAPFDAPTAQHPAAYQGAPGTAPVHGHAKNDQAYAAGAAFGLHADTQPTLPIDPSLLAAPSASSRKDRRGIGAGKVTAIVLAAALAGGLLGVGGGYFGASLAPKPASSTASGPSTITVNNPDNVNATSAIATAVLPSVVTLNVAGAQASGSGSGVILSADGYVLTNTHVVTLGGAEANATVRVTTSDGRIFNAAIVGTDPIYDLAVIKLSKASGLTPIDFADSSDVNVGSTAVALGAPLGLANSVTTGIVSALNRSIQIQSSAVPDTGAQDQQEAQPDSNGQGPFTFDLPGQSAPSTTGDSISISVIQTDAAINPGNSGGALVDAEGKLIGINVAIASAGGGSGEAGSIGVGFAIPSNVAKRVSEEIIANGSATHGLLGASVQDAASSATATVAGATIAEVTPGGAAEAGGLKKGDVVTKFNGVPIGSASDLTAEVRAAAAGSKATVTIVRAGKSQEITVTLGKLSL